MESLRILVLLYIPFAYSLQSWKSSKVQDHVIYCKDRVCSSVYNGSLASPPDLSRFSASCLQSRRRPREVWGWVPAMCSGFPVSFGGPCIRLRRKLGSLRTGLTSPCLRVRVPFLPYLFHRKGLQWWTQTQSWNSELSSRWNCKSWTKCTGYVILYHSIRDSLVTGSTPSRSKSKAWEWLNT